MGRNIPDANGAKLVSDEASINEGLLDKLAETEEMLTIRPTPVRANDSATRRVT